MPAAVRRNDSEFSRPEEEKAPTSSASANVNTVNNAQKAFSSSSSSPVNDALSYLVWPCIILLPLLLTYNDFYKVVFPSEWYVFIKCFSTFHSLP